MYVYIVTYFLWEEEVPFEPELIGYIFNIYSPSTFCLYCVFFALTFDICQQWKTYSCWGSFWPPLSCVIRFIYRFEIFSVIQFYCSI